ncbi:MAG: universal stress protein [Acidobacteriia bacterium]|nr:universal stress protein [Terriglobia bacterium]
MLITATRRLIQLKSIAVLTDLESDSEGMLEFAGALARWYGSGLMLMHACPGKSHPALFAGGSSAKEDARVKLKSLILKRNLQELVSRTIVLDGGVGSLLEELDRYRPDLLVLATHGREGIRKWLAGSVAEAVFRKVQWPVLLLGPGFSRAEIARQQQFSRLLYATDLSPASLAALQYAVGIAHDHEAQLIVLHVEPDSRQGFSFDRALALQRLQDWLHDHIDGLSATLDEVHCLVDFGRPETKIMEAASNWHADLLVVGARGPGVPAGLASHFLGGTAYEVVCSAGCPVLVVPQAR